ncbi:hypothetical protein [Bartonella sp. MU70NMGDW]|uniref:hypothetical protein n=1 Tax=Bartonella sp. MU70NMGDW TaxID=3243561 RepID=UPI0035CEF792
MKSKLFGNKPLLHTCIPKHIPAGVSTHTSAHISASAPQQGTTPQRHIHPALFYPLLLSKGHRLPEHWQADIKAAVSEGLSES